MPEDEREHGALFERDALMDPNRVEREKPTALVHVLTPEFHGLDAVEFADIPDEVVVRASADELRPNLFWSYVRRSDRKEPEVSAFSYRSAEGSIVSVALTPEEYDTASESVEKLAQRIFNKVLTQRDAALKKETGDSTVRARGDEDIRAAKRGGMRAVMDQQASMERLLQEGVMPKIELVERFMEMTRGRNSNLSRGTKESVSKRFDELRTTVFDDMLDAVALQRKWTEEMTERAKRIIQKRLYISGTVGQRVANFNEMLALAQEYYGYKRALLLTKIQDTKKYQRTNPDVVADIMAIDEERKQAKEAKQLHLDQTE
jgi:hypothetical protein